MTPGPREPEFDTTDSGETEFFGYPQDYIFAIFDDREEAAAAVAQLAGLGFTDEDVATFAGEIGADSIDSSGSEHGMTGVMVRTVEKAFANVDHMSQYDEAVQNGSAVVGVYAPEDDRREQASRVLLEYHTRQVNHFGSLVVETLRG